MSRVIDRAGQVFGELTVLHRVACEGQRSACWACRCSCGNELTLTSKQLTSGRSSCGCRPRRTPANYRPIEPGTAFGRLTVVERAPNQGSSAAWLCRCSCGGAKEVTGSSLRAGNVRSCGCVARANRFRSADDPAAPPAGGPDA